MCVFDCFPEGAHSHVTVCSVGYIYSHNHPVNSIHCISPMYELTHNVLEVFASIFRAFEIKFYHNNIKVLVTIQQLSNFLEFEFS